MKFSRLLALALWAPATLCFAHPGHDASALHLHAGPSLPRNSFEIGWIALGLLLSALLLRASRKTPRP